MAIIKLGALVVGVRGTIGGVTYSANKSGTYAKAWGKGSNPKTTRQQNSRGILASMGPAWQALTAGQRADWSAFAATDPEPHVNSLGEPVVFSGYMLFSMLNARNVQVGFPISNDVPSSPQDVRPATITILDWDPDLTGAGVICSWDPFSGATGKWCVFFIGLSPSPGSVVGDAAFKFVDRANSLDGLGVGSPNFVSVFGSDVLGWRASIWMYTQWTTGLRSVVASDTAIIT